MDVFGIMLLAFEASVGLWVCYLVWRTLRRRVTTLANAGCASCAKPYGIETARRARQDYRERTAAAQRAGTDRADVDRHWDVECPACHAAARYYYESERFDRRPSDARARRSPRSDWRGVLN